MASPDESVNRLFTKPATARLEELTESQGDDKAETREPTEIDPRDSEVRRADSRTVQFDPEDVSDPSFESSTQSSGDLGSSADVIFTYDSLWNEASREAWRNEKDLRFEDLEAGGASTEALARAGLNPLKRRHRHGSPRSRPAVHPEADEDSKTSPSISRHSTGMTSNPRDLHIGMEQEEGVERLLREVRALDPTVASAATHMLQLNVEPGTMSGSTIAFHFDVFIEQLFIQALFPLNLPILWCFYRSEALRNMMMTMRSTSCVGAIGSMMMGLFFFLTFLPVVMFVGWRELVPNLSLTELMACVGVYLGHRIMVAVKYATLPRNAYQVLMTMDVPAPVRDSEQLVRGWLRPSSIVILRELLEAASRLGVDFSSATFAFKPAAAEAVARLFGVIEPLLPKRARLPFRPGEIPMLYVLYSILARDVVGRSTRKMMFIPTVLAPLTACLFPLVRYLNGGQAFGVAGWDQAMICIVFVGTCLWTNSLFDFMLVALVDYKMRCNTLKALGSIVSRKWNRAEGKFFDPLIDLTTCPGNVATFVLARRLLLNVGLRYQKRAQILTGIMTVVTLGFGAGSIVMTLMGRTVVGWGMFEVFTVFELVVLGVFLAVMVMIGASANHRAEEHIALVAARQLEVRQKMVAIRMMMIYKDFCFPKSAASDPAIITTSVSVTDTSNLAVTFPSMASGAVCTTPTSKGSASVKAMASPHADPEIMASQPNTSAMARPEMVLATLEAIDRLLGPTKQAIESDAKEHPVRLLGQPASVSMMRNGFVLLATALSLALRVMWNA
jgi:hypothetical protein